MHSDGFMAKGPEGFLGHLQNLGPQAHLSGPLGVGGPMQTRRDVAWELDFRGGRGRGVRALWGWGWGTAGERLARCVTYFLMACLPSAQRTEVAMEISGKVSTHQKPLLSLITPGISLCYSIHTISMMLFFFALTQFITVHTHTHPHTGKCVYTHMHAHSCITYIDAHMYTCRCVHMHTHVCARIRVCTDAHKHPSFPSSP